MIMNDELDLRAREAFLAKLRRFQGSRNHVSENKEVWLYI